MASAPTQMGRPSGDEAKHVPAEAGMVTGFLLVILL